ncbi:unnamed protein product [Rangifer tarandus platyrhynchus]|uniref:Uncharacterized protein n=1 Tax=Rangifer tarandus platyrhynchus TaxID=3082113 RepID=A0ABN8YFS9_RANTA|nr:unnamed protein product [Rangifer tarandus platyrhynchus]
MQGAEDSRPRSIESQVKERDPGAEGLSGVTARATASRSALQTAPEPVGPRPPPPPAQRPQQRRRCDAQRGRQGRRCTGWALAPQRLRPPVPAPQLRRHPAPHLYPSRPHGPSQPGPHLYPGPVPAPRTQPDLPACIQHPLDRSAAPPCPTGLPHLAPDTHGAALLAPQPRLGPPPSRWTVETRGPPTGHPPPVAEEGGHPSTPSP